MPLRRNRSLYLSLLRPDYSQLARKYDDDKFSSHVVYGQNEGTTSYDFSDPEAICALNEILLREYFSLDVRLDPKFLCPRVSNRFKYILWIEDLLNCTVYRNDSDQKKSDQGGQQVQRDQDGLKESLSDHLSAINCPTNPQPETVGIDIGTGASCIYPLLGCATHTNWCFHATDISHTALELARENVARNSFTSRIHLIRSSAEKPILDPCWLPAKAHFTMCNPPFYSSEEEIRELDASKISRPISALAANNSAWSELITVGGEVEFIFKMIENSLELPDKVVWFTTMLGKKSSVMEVIERLRLHGISNYALHELKVSNHTRRWVIGWSFGQDRPRLTVCRAYSPDLKAYNPPVTEITFQLSNYDRETATTALDLIMASIDVAWSWKESRSHQLTSANDHIIGNLIGDMSSSKGDVWSRKWRRGRADKAQLGIEISIHTTSLDKGTKKRKRQVQSCGVRLNLWWYHGDNFDTFDSFTAMLRRKLTDRKV